MTAYQLALSTLTYINTAREPFPGTRVLILTVFDGVHHSDPVTANITLRLINDNILTLLCGVTSVNFTEGSPDPVPVATELTLVDFDLDHMIMGATVDIGVPQEGDEIRLNPSMIPYLDVIVFSDTSIQISGLASDDYYQVHCNSIYQDILK